MFTKLDNEILLDYMEIRSRRLRWFGGAVETLDLALNVPKRHILLRDLAFSVVRPVDLAGTDFPLVTYRAFEFGLG